MDVEQRRSERRPRRYLFPRRCHGQTPSIRRVPSPMEIHRPQFLPRRQQARRRPDNPPLPLLRRRFHLAFQVLLSAWPFIAGPRPARRRFGFRWKHASHRSLSAPPRPSPWTTSCLTSSTSLRPKRPRPPLPPTKRGLRMAPSRLTLPRQSPRPNPPSRKLQTEPVCMGRT
jgi:hypothetical protein